MTLERAAMYFLKWQKGCALVFTERSPREFWTGEPDVLGITEARYMLEIEIKRSMSDFRANAKKIHIARRDCEDAQLRNRCLQHAPKQFWYMVPRKLVDKALPECPPWAGLMTLTETGTQAEVMKPAPSNDASQRLSLKECAVLMRKAGSQIFCLLDVREQIRGQHAYLGHDSTFMDDIYSQPIWPGDKNAHGYTNFQI